MTHKRPLTLSLLLILGTQLLSAQTPRARIEAALAETRAAAAAEEKSNPSWKDFGPVLTAVLEEGEAAARAGQLYLAVEDLGRVRTYLSANHFAHRAAAEGMDGFNAAWTKFNDELPARLRAADAVPKDAPALTRALVQSAQFRARTLTAAARAYAGVTDAQAGFFYLGQAAGDLAWMQTAPSLGLTASGKPFRARSIAPELAALQARVNNAFQPPRSIDKHSAFIRLNASLKTATELNDAGLYYGALFHYLDATQQYSVLMNSDAPTPELETLRPRVAALATSPPPASAQDNSIALLFTQRALASLAVAKPDEQKVRAAAVLATDVLPAYETALKTPAAPLAKSARVIDVTLVRWPYT